MDDLISADELASLWGCSPISVRRKLQAAGVKRRGVRDAGTRTSAVLYSLAEAEPHRVQPRERTGDGIKEIDGACSECACLVGVDSSGLCVFCRQDRAGESWLAQVSAMAPADVWKMR